jgi:DNA-binding MarR family transcriptional regulator
MTEDQVRILEVDRIIHEPARFAILTILSDAEGADFLYLETETGLTHGNLGAHLARLESAGYIYAQHNFRGRVSHTVYSMTPAGHEAYARYLKWLRRAAASRPKRVKQGTLIGQLEDWVRAKRQRSQKVASDDA